MGHWSLSPPSRMGYSFYSARGSTTAASLKATNDQARALVTGGILGAPQTSDDFFKATTDASFAITTQQAAGRFAIKDQQARTDTSVDVTA